MLEILMDSPVVCVPIALLAIIAPLCIYFHSRHSSNTNKIPNILGLPVLGSAIDLAPNKMVQTLQANYKKYKHIGIYQMHAIQLRFIVVSDLTLVKEILLRRPRDFRRSRSLEVPLEVLDMHIGLFGAEGDTWKRLRKNNSPAFSKPNVLSTLGLVLEEANALVTRLKDSIGSTIQIDSELTFSLMQMISAQSLGNVNNSYLKSHAYRKDLLDMSNYLSERAAFPFSQYLWSLIPSLYALEVLGIAAHNRLANAALEAVEQSRTPAMNTDPSANRNLMSLILEKKSSEYVLSSKEGVAALCTFLIGGTDTATASSTWMLFYLSTYPQVLHQVRSEIDAFYTTYEHSVSDHLDELVALPILNSVFKEVLRIAPPANVLFFETTNVNQSLTIGNGRYTIQPNDQVWIDVDGLCRNESVFPDAYSFVPSRWLTSEATKLQEMNDAFLVFGSGPRLCPGMHLGTANVLIVVSCIVRHLDFALDCPVAEVERLFNFVARANKMPMKFSLRTDA